MNAWESTRCIDSLVYWNRYEKIAKSLSEYLPVKDLGYEDVIFTLYRVSHYSNEKIAQIIQSLDLFGLTMDPPRLRSGIADKIQNKDFLIYVHTVNSYLRFLQYKIFFGADEIYTDNLF